MKIKQDIVDKIDNPISRTRIAMDLKVGEQTVALQLRQNNDNGRLTKMDALSAISKEVGIPVNEILEEATVETSK